MCDSRDLTYMCCCEGEAEPSDSANGPCLKSLNAKLLALTPAMAESRLTLKNGAGQGKS
jgi:hypothetical protein